MYYKIKKTTKEEVPSTSEAATSDGDESWRKVVLEAREKEEVLVALHSSKQGVV